MKLSQKLKTEFGSDPDSSFTPAIILSFLADIFDKLEYIDSVLKAQATEINQLRQAVAHLTDTQTAQNSAVKQSEPLDQQANTSIQAANTVVPSSPTAPEATNNAGGTTLIPSGGDPGDQTNQTVPQIDLNSMTVE